MVGEGRWEKVKERVERREQEREEVRDGERGERGEGGSEGREWGKEVREEMRSAVAGIVVISVSVCEYGTSCNPLGWRILPCVS